MAGSNSLKSGIYYYALSSKDMDDLKNVAENISLKFMDNGIALKFIR